MFFIRGMRFSYVKEQATNFFFFFLFERSESFSETEWPANLSHEVKIDKRFNVKYGQGKTNCQRRNNNRWGQYGGVH